MNIRHIALAAAVALSTPAMAATQYDAVDSSTSFPAKKAVIDSVYPALFSEWLSSWETAYSDLYGGYSIGGATANFATNFTATITSSLGGQSQSFVYTISKLSGSGLNTVYQTAANYQTAVAVEAVPGPEAGAGLGALALGGMALFLKRRRGQEALAA